MQVALTISIVLNIILVIISIAVIGAASINVRKNREERNKMNITEKCDNTTALLDTLTGILTREIEIFVIEMSMLNTTYQMKNLDDDIEAISSRVFDSIKKQEVFGNKGIIVTDVYIMNFIVKNTRNSVILALQKHNFDIRSNS